VASVVPRSERRRALLWREPGGARTEWGQRAARYMLLGRACLSRMVLLPTSFESPDAPIESSSTSQFSSRARARRRPNRRARQRAESPRFTFAGGVAGLLLGRSIARFSRPQQSTFRRPCRAPKRTDHGQESHDDRRRSMRVSGDLPYHTLAPS